MKNVLFIFFLVLQLDVRGQIPGPGECTRAEERYTDLNSHLLADRQDDSDATPKVALHRTRDLTGFITQVVLARLTDIGDAGAIRSYLDCMQEEESRSERPLQELTDTPQVFLTRAASMPLALSAMLILRGGTGVPNTLPLVQCFAQVGGRWTLVGSGNEQGFNGHQLYIHQLRSPTDSEAWYLLSGRAIGDTGGRLRMEVVACGDKQMRTVWERDGIIWGEVRVNDRSTISLTYVKQESPETAKRNGDKLGPEMIIEDDTGNRKEFSELLRVTSKGLEP